MKFTIAPSISLKLGYLRLAECRVAASSDALRKTYEDVAAAARKRFSNSPLGEHPVVCGVRQLFKSSGIDPSRYRPSGEALVRRIIRGQSLYNINCIVDINNICSIGSLFPLGSYDCHHSVGDINIRLGTDEESYEGIGKQIRISGKLVSADSEGAFGSPIADSNRTKITESTREVLVLLYAPESTDDRDIAETLSRFVSLASEHAGARPLDSGIYSAEHRGGQKSDYFCVATPDVR
jgi:DNA/RNA-binding domain of Phe-tRNA-synthetase-like protein